MSVGFTDLRIGSILSSAKNIYISACAAEIAEAPALFRQHRPVNATITGIFSPFLNRRSYADPEIGLRMRTFFLTSEVKQHLTMGLIEYCPWRYSMIDRWLSTPGRFDTALVMLSPPDNNGKCSLGVQTDFLPGFHDRIERLVGFINPNMPRTAGDGLVDYTALTSVVDYDVPLKTLTPRALDPVAVEISTTIAELIPDHATVQFGIGQIPSQVMAHLGSHRGIRVHTGIVDDHILTLDASGALDRNEPIVTGTAIGTAELYQAIADERRFSFRAVSHTHSHRTIGELKRFTAVNSVLQADLLGQVSAEGNSGKLVASPGGLPDFARGALSSEGGRSIIAVRAKAIAGRSKGIVPLLEMPQAVTNTAADADIIVSEFGAAHVRDLAFDARAEAIIAIAAPEDHEFLTKQWAKIRGSLLASV